MTELSGEPANGLEWFGMELLEALRHKGVKQKELATFSGYKEPYVSKVKNGQAKPSPEFAQKCDVYFGTSGYFERMLVRISEYGGHPSWFVPYLRLEREATHIVDYSNAFIMGMLQTEAYATAIFKSTHPRETDEQIAARVEARVRRRDLMEGDSPPLLWVILHESTLRTVVGDRQTMAAQLRHLVASVGPNISVQVLPFAAGAPASSLPFTLLTLEEGATVLYSETRGLGHVSDSAGAVLDSQSAYDRLRAAALSCEKSQAFISKVAEEYGR
ncbi:helix-turn-helix transcriptional regulator [Streptomyces sp. NPDC000594]|uniref:helix-turn-helix domain-containing protein n=1 Tax=Streptomyces sp. NPDC000594 TaxID=3154261 RepID=UPI00331A22B1